MKKILESIGTYYSLFGMNGVLMRARSGFSEKPLRVLVEVPGMRFPVCIRLGTSDVFTLSQVFIVGGYDWEFAVPPSVIVDAGANIGLASAFFANQYPEARIIAIEPELANFEMLNRNVSMYPNVRTIRGALWKENKEIRLFNPGAGMDGFQTREKETEGPEEGSEFVPGMTMENVLSTQGISFVDVLKIDIEGAEREVFESPSSWIGRVGVIMVELHDRIKIGCSTNVYNATPEFESVSHCGEAIILARPEFVHGASNREKPVGARGSNAHARAGGIRLRIVEVVNQGA
jgi:FkbM family methyltransferase